MDIVQGRPRARAGSRGIPSEQSAARGAPAVFSRPPKPPLAGELPGPGRRPGGCLPWPVRPSRNSTREPRGPGSVGLPTRGGEAVLAEKVRVEARPAPSLRKPGYAGQPGFRRRTDGPRKGSPSPDNGWRATRSLRESSRRNLPVKPGQSPARGPLHLHLPGPKAWLARPAETEASAKTAAAWQTRSPKAPSPSSRFSVDPRLGGTEVPVSRSSRERAAPAVIRRFHVQEDARPTCRGRQHKITLMLTETCA